MFNSNKYTSSALLIALTFATASGCGRSDDNDAVTYTDLTINAPMKAVTQPAVLGDVINFTALKLNATQPSNDLINCDGSMGNNGSVNGVASGSVRTTGTPYKGTIQFGNVAYVGATDSRCHDISKEAYSYDADSKGGITICLTNALYPYCTTYQLSISL
jgi:hypothetical protein